MRARCLEFRLRRLFRARRGRRSFRARRSRRLSAGRSIRGWRPRGRLRRGRRLARRRFQPGCPMTRKRAKQKRVAAKARKKRARLPLRKMGDALPKVGKRCHLADRCRKGQSLLPRCPLPDKERLGRRRRVRSLVWPGGRVRRRVLPVRCRRPFPHRVRLLRPRCRVRRLRSRGLHGPAGSACQDGAGYGISCFRSGPLVV